MVVHDLLGIGFGPSNIALAIALEERCQSKRPINALFIEKQPSFAWHQNMLLNNTHMQISFLKDLATLRNPTSRFTFINYLHQKNRLQDFINLKTFFPSRHEFNDYFSWAAAQFEDQCIYGETVVEVLPEKQGGEVTLLRVRCRDEGGAIHDRLARNLVVSTGGTAKVPSDFRPLQNDPRVFHTSTYLRDIARNAEAKKIAIIGAGQSAAEIFMDLHGRPGAPQIDLIMRGRAIKPADSSPFVNEIFNSDFVDRVYARTRDERSELLREFWHTNYACPDLALIEQIFNVLYQQKVTGDARYRLLREHEVKHVQASDQGIELSLRDMNAGDTSTVRYDAVVLATGYEREQHKTLLAPIAAYLQGFEVDRHYRLKSAPGFRPAVFLQGACEASHGLSDTLLSITAVRTGEIGEALAASHHAPQHSSLGAMHAVQA